MSNRRPRIGPPRCYGFSYDPNDPTCQQCDWSRSCADKKATGSIGCPHTNEQLELIKSRRGSKR